MVGGLFDFCSGNYEHNNNKIFNKKEKYESK
jgi:hypothetical protein